MQVILLKDIEKVGEKHTIVTVKPGYGRNYLIPKKLAVVANDTNKGKLDEIIAKAEAEAQKEIDAFKVTAAAIDGKTVKLSVKAGSEGKIFGSVTTIQVSQAIKEQLGVDVDRKIIAIEEEVKTLGTYVAEVTFHPEVKSNVQFELIAD